MRESISSAEDFARFNLYAYRVVAPRIRRDLDARDGPIRHLLVLSAPRSGSTILGRLLNANPAIAGFGENHADYADLRDLDRLVYRTASMVPDFDARTMQWVFDKIVGQHDVSDELLTSENLRYLFIARNPFAIYSSTIRLFDLPNTRETATNWSVEYSDRVAQLTSILQAIGPGTGAWFGYEDLLENPTETLAHLTRFLDLETPLPETFPAASGPLRLKYGDISGNVGAGKLVKPTEAPPEPDPAVFDSELVASVHETHNAYLDALAQHAQSRSPSNACPPPK